MSSKAIISPKQIQAISEAVKRHADVIVDGLHRTEEQFDSSPIAECMPEKAQRVFSTQLYITVQELSRITHQINRCMQACGTGDIEEMVKLRDEILKKRTQVH